MWGPWKWIEEWAAIHCLKSRNGCNNSWTGGQRPLNDHWVDGGSGAHDLENSSSDSSWRYGARGRSGQSSLCTVCPYFIMTVKSFLVNPCMVEISHSPHTSLLLLFLKAKTERKQILECWRHKAEHDHHIIHGPVGCFQWLLCAASRKM